MQRGSQHFNQAGEGLQGESSTSLVRLEALLDLLVQLEPEAIQGQQLVRIAGLGPQFFILAASRFSHRLEHRPGVGLWQKPAQQVFSAELRHQIGLPPIQPRFFSTLPSPGHGELSCEGQVQITGRCNSAPSALGWLPLLIGGEFEEGHGQGMAQVISL